jgi:uncharacterized protein
MDITWNPRHLDIPAFARADARLQGQAQLSQWPRLQAEQFEGAGESLVHWSLKGQLRPIAGGASEVALSLKAEAQVPLQCQRCLQKVVQTVVAERDYLFASDEAAAAAMDAESEIDVLAISRDFDALSLVEDELIMALPLVPRHEMCLQTLPASTQDVDVAASSERPNPFAGLAVLKNRG